MTTERSGRAPTQELGPHLNAPDPRLKGKLEASASSSKTCIIYAERTGATGYGWGWRTDGKHSKGLFRYFYECVQDARKHGYAVDLEAVAQSLRPGPPRTF